MPPSRPLYSRAACVVLLLGYMPFALAWGAVGHEIVATIAQIHLHDHARESLRQLLPYSSGHLAPIASWADRIRGIPAYHFSGELHYTSPLGDYPPEQCHFGDQGWKTDHDVLHAITNYTGRVMSDPSDVVSLRFLVHFLGDVHQPLHLTNRDRGGNSDPVTFEGRRMNLHGLWDGQLIAKALRDQANYTRPLPSRQIEESLRGTIYDSYIRLMLWEGVRQWWRSSISTWLTCPSAGLDEAFQVASWPLQVVDQLAFSHESPDLSRVVCPVSWATETHKYTCALAFPPGLIPGHVPELYTKEYYGPIRDNNVIEKLLVQGGLRLAAILNVIFAPTGSRGLDREPQDLLNLQWLQDADTRG